MKIKYLSIILLFLSSHAIAIHPDNPNQSMIENAPLKKLYLQDLSDDTLRQLIFYLDHKSIIELSLTSKKFNSLINDFEKSLPFLFNIMIPNQSSLKVCCLHCYEPDYLSNQEKYTAALLKGYSHYYERHRLFDKEKYTAAFLCGFKDYMAELNENETVTFTASFSLFSSLPCQSYDKSDNPLAALHECCRSRTYSRHGQVLTLQHEYSKVEELSNIAFIEVGAPSFITIDNFNEDQRDYLNAYFRWAPGTTLVVDLCNLLTEEFVHVFRGNHNINHLSVLNQNQVTSIEVDFLYKRNNLWYIDLSNLNQITSIGSYRFLDGSRSLKKVTLAESMRNGIVHQRLLVSHPNISIQWIS